MHEPNRTMRFVMEKDGRFYAGVAWETGITKHDDERDDRLYAKVEAVLDADRLEEAQSLDNKTKKAKV